MPNPFAVIALAVGMATFGSMVQLLDATLIRPVPYASPDRLVQMPLQSVVPIYSRREVADLATLPSFAALGAYSMNAFTIALPAQPVQVPGGRATGSLIDVLGVRPAAGRLFRPSDSEPGAEAVALISYPFWQEAYGSDPSAVGMRLDVVEDDGQLRAYRIIGVLPRHAGHPFRGTSVWLPVVMDPVAPNWQAKNANLNPIARLAEGQTTVSAQAAITPMIKGWVDRAPAGAFSSPERRAEYRARIDAAITPLPAIVSSSSRSLALALFAFAVLVLASSASMVANLIIARGLRRSSEFAIRYQLGATRGRIMMLIMGESAWLAGLASAAALLLMVAAAPFVRSHLPIELDADARVIGIVTALAVTGATAVVALVLGLAGAFPAIESIALHSLRSGRSRSRGRFLAEHALLAVSTSLTVTLTAGAGLMLRTVRTVSHQNPGFDPAGLVSIAIQPTIADASRSHALWDAVVNAIAARGDVSHAGVAYNLPLTGSNPVTDIRFEDHPTIPRDERQIVRFQLASPGYVETMGLRILEGRAFDRGDDASAPGVALVNAAFAREFFGSEPPLGRRLSVDSGREIIGVVSDVHHAALEDAPEPRVYYPVAQFAPRALRLVARTTASPAAIAIAVRDQLAILDPYAVVTSADRYADIQAASMQQRTQLLDVLQVFAAFGLFLSALGVFGSMHSWLAERRREAAIRSAIGATGSTIVRWIAAAAAIPVVAGGAIGVALAVAAGRLLSGVLYGVEPWDPVVLIATLSIQLVVGAIALAHPAAAAARTDPNRELNRA